MSEDLEPIAPDVAVEEYIATREPSVAPSTLRNDRTRLEKFIEWCELEEIENLNTLTGRDLSRYVAWRRDQVKPITLQKQLSTIRTFLEWAANIEAVEDGLREKVHTVELPDGAESSDVTIDAERAEAILEYLNRYHYASREHAIVALVWRTGMRLGAVYSIDIDDLHPEDDAIELVHRPETDTPLKNDSSGERWVYLGPHYYQILEDYIEANRIETADDHGRRPLFTSNQGRLSKSAIRDIIYRSSHPCLLGECPHDRIPEECEAVGASNLPSKCPSARGPHAFRRGSITHHLLDDTDPNVVSERMDVSLDVLYRHYDARRPDEKMRQRKKFLSDK